MPQSASRLLQLPDTCLQEVLQCCADDPRSLFSAARAHSRLHQAAVQAFSSIRAVVTERDRGIGILQYLSNHGKHVHSLGLSSYTLSSLSFFELPHEELRGLSSLRFSRLVLHLHPQQGVQSLLGEGARLKQLVLHKCKLLEQGRGFAAALAAALSARPELQHLSIDMPNFRMGFPSRVLQKLQQLTYLELSGMQLHSRDALRHLHALTRLQELRLAFIEGAKAFQAVAVSGLQRLSVLKVNGLFDGRLWLGVLAGSPRLQHLEVSHGGHLGGAAGVAEFWSHLQSQQQLTHLSLSNSIRYWESCRLAVYSALTASSVLQHLAIKEIKLPAGVWQHIFPAGRQLPHLQTLQIDRVHEPSNDFYRGCAATAPNVSLLVDCCPRLRSLSMEELVYNAVLLAPLTGLSALQELNLDSWSMSAEGWEVVSQLTGLKQLILQGCREVGSMELLQLTKLQQLTHLSYKAFYGEENGTWTAEAAGDKPVWRQVLKQLSTDIDPEVAQQAASALAE